MQGGKHRSEKQKLVAFLHRLYCLHCCQALYLQKKYASSTLSRYPLQFLNVAPGLSKQQRNLSELDVPPEPRGAGSDRRSALGPVSVTARPFQKALDLGGDCATQCGSSQIQRLKCHGLVGRRSTHNSESWQWHP